MVLECSDWVRCFRPLRAAWNRGWYTGSASAADRTDGFLVPIEAGGRKAKRYEETKSEHERGLKGVVRKSHVHVTISTR